MVNFIHKDQYRFDDLVSIMQILRSDEGCPWDREQTHESVRMNFIEETYEVCEAIDKRDIALLREELGDVLMQVVFHSEMEREVGNFDIDDVADEVCKKLIHRHPHIFGDVTVSGADEVLSNWEDIKRREKGQETFAASLDSVARSLPALMRAEKLQKRAKKSGFDWPDISGAFEKILEELEELRSAVEEQSNIEEELGDLLFAVVNVSRFLKINPESALDRANEKFLARFAAMEQLAADAGHDLSSMTLSEMDVLWEKAKRQQKVAGE